MQKRSWFDSASEHQIQDVDGKQSDVKQNNGFFGINGQIHQYAKQNQKRSSGSGQIFFQHQQACTDENKHQPFRKNRIVDPDQRRIKCCQRQGIQASRNGDKIKQTVKQIQKQSGLAQNHAADNIHIVADGIKQVQFYIAERRKPDIGNAGAFAFREVDRGADAHQIKICKQTHFLTVSNCTQDYKGQKSPDSGHFVAS